MREIFEKDYIPPAGRKVLDIKKYSKNEDLNKFLLGTSDFYTICQAVRKHVYSVYDEKIEQKANGDTREDYVSIYHGAIIGLPSSVNLIKKHIEEYIIENGLQETEYPKFYKNLIDALFEEEFGWGPLAVFKYEKDCEGAQVLGTDIKFKRDWGYELQPFRFRNVEQVFELAKRFSNMDPRTTLNEHTSPEIETKTHDNIRVSIIIPGRMHSEPVITLRRKRLPKVSFEAIAHFNTIPKEAIPIFQALSRFRVNSVVAGPPGCGKSTMLQAFLDYALYEMRNGKKQPERINTVYAEVFPEWDVREIHPRSNVLHMIGKGEEFEKIIAATSLRHDISRVVLGEIREHEVGLYLRASLQGIKQVMGTIHDRDPRDIPDILSNLYMQYFSNGVEAQYIRQTFARNLHFTVSMDEFLYEENGVERLEKKVTGIHLYEVQPATNETKLYTIMEYMVDEKEWRYSSEIPEVFKRMVEKENAKEFKTFISTLTMLENRSLVAVGR